MRDVPNIAVFCSESIERFPGTVSKFFLKLLLTILVAPIITGIIVHYYYYYGGGGDGCGGGGGGGDGGGGGGQNIAYSKPKPYYDIHFPFEASSTYTAIFRNSILCAGRLTYITATLKRKMTVKRREESRIRKHPIRVLQLSVCIAPLTLWRRNFILNFSTPCI
jgi:hypothetical protein